MAGSWHVGMWHLGPTGGDSVVTPHHREGYHARGKGDRILGTIFVKLRPLLKYDWPFT